MNNTSLKILAILFMTIDHLGHFIPESPYYIPMRMIGRLSFPIFLFLIIQGYKHTSDILKYIINLFTFALISILPFYYAFGLYFNVYFTLATVVMMLYLFYNTENEIFNFLIFIVFFVFSKPFDWGQPAILTVYLLRNKLSDDNKLAVYLPLTLGFSTWIYYVTDYSFVFLKDFIQNPEYKYQLIESIFASSLFVVSIMLSTIFLTSYNGERGFKFKGYKKYIFYIYYPLHLIIIATFFKSF